MIFPTGYEEDYQYREDIIKPNQVVDPRRQTKVQHTNHDRSNRTIVLPSHVPLVNGNNHLSHQQLTIIPNVMNSSSFDANYNFDRSESQYAGLVESQL
jgi:hypothetical protein